ncbi:MAG TPA: phosphate regulon sensor histidine kinase PhoR [Steroidobacteraceae bacterium]|nr:phosphate regulon sensor histidine kinase PhoR [Steroidobacteraceae bacterium]
MKLPRVLSVGWQALSRLGLALIVCVVLGFFIGQAHAFAIVFTAYALWQTWNLVRLEHWLRFRSIEAPPDIGGTWGEVVAIVSRIYRRKQYHRARVIELLREFRRLTSAMPEGAVLLNGEHQILWFNRRAAAWLGLRRKRDFGIRIENLVRYPDFIDYLSTGEPEAGVVVHDTREGGRWLSFHVVRTGAGERQLLILRDVSREQHLQAMRKDFVANASHELRSPLTVISGYLDALSDDEQLDSAWSAPVREMRRQAERMSTIIRDLLELSKLESGDRAADEQPIDVGGMLALLRKEVIPVDVEAAQIHLSIDGEEWLMGSESEIHSILANLLTNAIKYTPASGRIDVRWWTDDDGGYVSVRDTGLGIAPEHLPRLTERFYRVDSGRSRDMGGSGLGLAIVKHALQRHGGSLEIQSEEGKGSAFICHFPASRLVHSLKDHEAAG